MLLMLVTIPVVTLVAQRGNSALLQPSCVCGRGCTYAFISHSSIWLLRTFGDLRGLRSRVAPSERVQNRSCE